MKSNDLPSVLVVCIRMPWPTTAGGTLRDWQNILCLAEFANVSVIFLQGSSTIKPTHHNKRIVNWMSISDLKRIFPPPYTQTLRHLRRNWTENDLGHWSDELWDPQSHHLISLFAQTHDFSFSVIEDQVLWRYITAIRGYCPIIIDCHNIQSHLDYEEANTIPKENSVRRNEAMIAARNMRQIEQNIRDEKFFVCSETDQKRLMERGVRPSSIAIVSNCVSEKTFTGDKRIGEPLLNSIDPVILFAGALDYGPNVRAAQYLIYKVFPIIKKRIENCKLLIMGMNPDIEILDAAYQEESVFLTGKVDNPTDYFDRATVLSVPLAEGGGTRFKILEAFSRHLPVVTSKKGCEGLEVKNNKHLLIADDERLHAEAIINLLESTELRDRLSKSGFKLFLRKYSIKTAKMQVRCAVRDLLGGFV